MLEKNKVDVVSEHSKEMALSWLLIATMFTPGRS